MRPPVCRPAEGATDRTPKSPCVRVSALSWAQTPLPPLSLAPTSCPCGGGVLRVVTPSSCHCRGGSAAQGLWGAATLVGRPRAGADDVECWGQRGAHVTCSHKGTAGRGGRWGRVGGHPGSAGGQQLRGQLCEPWCPGSRLASGASAPPLGGDNDVHTEAVTREEGERPGPHSVSRGLFRTGRARGAQGGSIPGPQKDQRPRTLCPAGFALGPRPRGHDLQPEGQAWEWPHSTALAPHPLSCSAGPPCGHGRLPGRTRGGLREDPVSISSFGPTRPGAIFPPASLWEGPARPPRPRAMGQGTSWAESGQVIGFRGQPPSPLTSALSKTERPVTACPVLRVPVP